MFKPALFGAALLAIASTQALACKGPNLQFSDDFTEIDEAWSPVNADMMKIDGGKLNLSSDVNKLNYVTYEGAFFPVGDACVDITFPGASSRDAMQTAGGLIFGNTSWQDFYILMIRPDGYAWVSRLSKNSWLRPIPTKKFDAIKTGPNAVNQLRVKFTKTTAQAYINDKLFANLKIMSDENAKVGFYVESEGSTWLFDNLKITD
ncbi:MAG: hypothetical protein U1E62_07890 [Alsobacter sp.]